MKRISYLIPYILLLFLSCESGIELPVEKDYLSLAFTEKQVGCTANTISLTVEANCTWTITNSADWILITPEKSIYNQASIITLAIQENKETSGRSAQIFFHYSKDEQVVSLTIFQDGFAPLISLSDSIISFGYRSAEKNIGISSNCGWYAKSDREWITIRPTTGLIGLFEMNILIETNPMPLARNATIHIINDTYNLDSVIEISQAAQVIVDNKSYIDEYGIDWGNGINIHGLSWAPVNCGYHQELFPYGKLFQWGRRTGLGYQDIITAPLWTGRNGDEEEGVFYLPGENSAFGYDWILSGSNHFWNLGTEEFPARNDNLDPCPEGWRVPTAFEFRSLIEYAAQKGWEIRQDVSGFSFADEPDNKVFLPAGGRLNTTDGMPYDKDVDGYYWTSTTLSGNPGYLYFSRENCQVNDQGSRAGACLVRCIKE